MNPIIERLEAGTLTRGQWSGWDCTGRATACLYAALVPGATSTKNCPASLMPQWIAHLTPWIDDSGSMPRWAGFVRRYAVLVEFFGRMTNEQSEQLEMLFLAACVRERLIHAPEGDHVLACMAVVEALEARRWPTEQERDAAERAAERAEAMGAWMVWAAAWAAWTAWAGRPERATEWAERAESADQMIDKFLELAEAMKEESE